MYVCVYSTIICTTNIIKLKSTAKRIPMWAEFRPHLIKIQCFSNSNITEVGKRFGKSISFCPATNSDTTDQGLFFHNCFVCFRISIYFPEPQFVLSFCGKNWKFRIRSFLNWLLVPVSKINSLSYKVHQI